MFLQDQGGFFRLAVGALILVLLPVFYLFLYLVQRYHSYILKMVFNQLRFFTNIQCCGQTAVIWTAELKNFVASPKLDGNQSHHDCWLVTLSLLNGHLLVTCMAEWDAITIKSPLINNRFVPCWLPIILMTLLSQYFYVSWP